MSRSYREPAYDTCTGSCPEKGKKATSRSLRHKVRVLCREVRGRSLGEGYDAFGGDLDVYLDDSQDRCRGRAGSRSPDWGWMYFGDGRRCVFYTRPKPREHVLSSHEEDVWIKYRRLSTRKLAEKYRRK